MILSSIFKFRPTAQICPELAFFSHIVNLSFTRRICALEVVRENSGRAHQVHMSPDHGKTRGDFHVKVVGNCSLVYSQIEKKLQSQPENLKIWWIFMNRFHVEVVGHCSPVHS